ncbi:MAG: hypothetical protein ACRC6I_21990, partial [Paracoccaceae bacterium]
MAVKLNTADLEFILRQIKIAEANSAGTPLTEIYVDANGNPVAAGTPGAIPAIPDPHVPYGLRTVDGTYNNLVPGRETWGAADQPMPRLLNGNFINDADGDTITLGPNTVTNNNYGQNGNVADADPRIISNLIVDMSVNNPAAVAVWFNNEAAVAAWHAKPGNEFNTPVAPGDARIGTSNGEGIFVAITTEDLSTIPNVAPDEGISKPFNAWMTFFGQFFDHGLDLITKGGNGTVFIPLQDDDPLVLGANGIPDVADDPTTADINEAAGNDDLAPQLRFMAMTRSTPVAGPGADGVMGTADDTTHEGLNTTTPFIDQNQTYTSHASHQVFLREYALDADGRPVATGHLLDGVNGGLPTWADVKAQARDILGIELSDLDVVNIPLIRTDAYGEFVRDPVTGFAQVVIGLGPDGIPNTDDDITASGTPAAP